MGLLSKLVLLLGCGVVLLLALCASGVLDRFAITPLPPLPAREYWGPGPEPAAPASEKIDPMQISVSKEAHAALQVKLKSFKFIQPLEGSKFEYGFNGNFMQQVVQHWLQRYSWKEWEQRLNSLQHYSTQLEGLRIHFIRARASPKAKRTLPIILVHGWPGSVIEFHKLIPMLTEPDSNGLAFEVIAPSIPGYAWSQAASKPGLNTAVCARIFHKLMQRLGHSRYYAQGGDWGAMITHIMARYYQDSVLGHHTNMPLHPFSLPSVMLTTIAGAYLPGVFSTRDSEKLYPYLQKLGVLLRETGYMHLQATKPDTVGHALHDSPVGLAAYILEKFCFWTVPTDISTDTCNLMGKGAHFTIDELLTNVMIYWTTDSITSSMRFYKENFASGLGEMDSYQVQPTKVPNGVASFKNELMRVPERFVRLLSPNLLRYTDFDHGGHFASLQLPKVMNSEIREFVRLAEEFHRGRPSAAQTEL